MFQPLYYLPPSKKRQKEVETWNQLHASTCFHDISQGYSKQQQHLKNVAAHRAVSFRCHSCNLHFLRQLSSIPYILLDIKNYSHLPWPSPPAIPLRKAEAKTEDPASPTSEGSGGVSTTDTRDLEAALRRRNAECARLTEAESHAEAKVRQLEKRLAHYENHESLHLARKMGRKRKKGCFVWEGEKGREEMICISVSMRC